MGSVFITLILVGAGGYFGLPALFPNLTVELGDYVEEDDLTDDGILLQSKLEMFNDTANILSSQLTPIPIPGTNMSFTIQNIDKK